MGSSVPLGVAIYYFLLCFMASTYPRVESFCAEPFRLNSRGWCRTTINNHDHHNGRFNNNYKISEQSTGDNAPVKEDTYYKLGVWSQNKLNIDAEAALKATVDKFYTAVIVDEELEKYFAGADLEKLKKHQFNFMRFAFSNGRYSYGNKSIEDGHSRLFKMGLNGHHFDVVAGHLVNTLKAMDVPEEIQTEVVEVVMPLRQIFVDSAAKQAATESATTT